MKNVWKYSARDCTLGLIYLKITGIFICAVAEVNVKNKKERKWCFRDDFPLLKSGGSGGGKGKPKKRQSYSLS